MRYRILNLLGLAALTVSVFAAPTSLAHSDPDVAACTSKCTSQSSSYVQLTCPDGPACQSVQHAWHQWTQIYQGLPDVYPSYVEVSKPPKKLLL